VFDVFSEDDCRRILDRLLECAEPQTQRQLSTDLELKSSVVSRRMADIEGFGLVTRASSHAPYDLHFPSMVRQLLDLGADLASAVARRKADEATAFAKERRLNGLREGALLDHAKESS
jgi:DNA-binding MarR family transcriptional regulator